MCQAVIKVNRSVLSKLYNREFVNQDIDSERFKIFLNMLEIIDFPAASWMPKLTNNIEILACN